MKNSLLKWRFIIIFIMLLLTKVIYAGLLYISLGGPRGFKVPVMDVWKAHMPLDWLYLFSAWDTGHYIMIVNSWYSLERSYLWAFFPLYPFMIKVLTFVGVNVWISAFLISIIAGTLSIIVFQKVAKKYLSEDKALIVTLLYFLFPPIFIFSTVCYTEPLFLLFSLLSWNFYLLKRNFKSALFASLTTMTRPNGILIIIPIIYDCLRERRLKNTAYFSFPILTLLGWSFYGYQITKDPFILLSARLYWRTDKIQALENALNALFHGDTYGFFMLQKYFYIAFGGLLFIILILFLSYRAWKLNNSLGLYSFLSTLTITCFGYSTSFISFPRILSFLFPIGLSLNFKNRFITAIALISFLMLSYVCWLAFLTTDLFH
ncbi:MAG: mannosyltransferase family protein [Candidatus Bathyarchaeia archaeon]